MKKLLKLGTLALLIASAALLVSCSNDSDDDDNESSAISKIVGIRYGTGVSTKAIYKYYTVLEGNKVRYEQTKFGAYTEDVIWDYKETVNEDGTITLNVSNGVSAIDGHSYGTPDLESDAEGYVAPDFGDEPIIIDISEGIDTIKITSYYYEHHVPTKTENAEMSRAYTGIEKLIGNIYKHGAVDSSKSIYSTYSFSADGKAKYNLIKYSKVFDKGEYKFTIGAAHLLSKNDVIATGSEDSIIAYDKALFVDNLKSFNRYLIHFVYAKTEDYKLTQNTYEKNADGTVNYNATAEVTKSVVEGEEPETAYYIIELTSDDAKTFNLYPAEVETAETTATGRDGTVSTSTTYTVTIKAGDDGKESTGSNFAIYTE